MFPPRHPGRSVGLAQHVKCVGTYVDYHCAFWSWQAASHLAYEPQLRCCGMYCSPQCSYGACLGCCRDLCGTAGSLPLVGVGFCGIWPLRREVFCGVCGRGHSFSSSVVVPASSPGGCSCWFPRSGLLSRKSACGRGCVAPAACAAGRVAGCLCCGFPLGLPRPVAGLGGAFRLRLRFGAGSARR